HEKVLCIADNAICMDKDRMDGCRHAMGEGRTDFLQLPFENQERRRFYEEKLEIIRSYTAIFAASDYYAVELMHFLQEKGVRVPEEVSIVGFDDSPLCDKVHPALTSIRQDPAERARLALEILQKLRCGNYEQTDVRLAVHLVERASVKRR
ncbi:MAG: substrate-binding domain-containing protein, partial [Candidatus Limivivens sp.]|nr:substrate-binding domain-containing protein [Candidatus Limivivens sp.]